MVTNTVRREFHILDHKPGGLTTSKETREVSLNRWRGAEEVRYCYVTVNNQLVVSSKTAAGKLTDRAWFIVLCSYT